MFTKTILPIDSLKNEILSSFETYSNIILKASPGSGKTTRLPLYLLEKTSKKIYILEPRRLAAKLAAQQVARELNEEVGHRVGYVFRYEKIMSEKTQIIFLTEGTFLKILSQNKNLSDVGVIILDEFHERHLSTDASLCFVTKLQKENRPDLKIIIMSATIETENLQIYLEQFSQTKTIELIAHRFPLEINYLQNVTSTIQAPLHKKVYNAISEILTLKLHGDVLVFLPGMSEIRDCMTILENVCELHKVVCLILHGDMDSNEQIFVLERGIKRKIILSTNIAESSITIPGIRIVIDSGLQRESSYNFYSGLPELKMTKISKASAIQRAGRSNREGEGKIFRLFAELDYDQRLNEQKPEIQRSDLSEYYLIALNLFDTTLENLSWFENPPPHSLKIANELLFSINAIDRSNQITIVGKKILQYPLHPRFGRILVESETISSLTYRETLTFIAELLGEKNISRLSKKSSAQPYTNSSVKFKSLAEILLTGFSDRVARTRGEKYFDVITHNGETLKISPQISHLFDPNHSLWIILELNNKGQVTNCVAIEEDWLYDLEPTPLLEDSHYFWDEKKEFIQKTERIMLGKILISETRSRANSINENTKKILLDIAENFIKTLYVSQEYERLLTLNKLLSNSEINFSFTSILENYVSDLLFLKPEDKQQLAQYFFSALKDYIDPNKIYNLENDFPMSIQLTDRRVIPIIYDHSQDPAIETFIQDFYGLSKTPILAKGKIPLTLKLLGPHKRALQVTQDLESFWKKTYPKMFKELTREYPRHYWPLNPENALPVLLKRQLPQ